MRPAENNGPQAATTKALGDQLGQTNQESHQSAKLIIMAKTNKASAEMSFENSGPQMMSKMKGSHSLGKMGIK